MTLRKRFIEGAIMQVAAVGIENVRTKQIAAYGEKSEATMYSHFRSKEALLREAFLVVDKRVSALLTESKYFKGEAEITDFETMVHDLWHDIFRYLIDNKEQTLFLIRYRYSAYYNDSVRAQRQAYSGAFEKVYDYIEGIFDIPDTTYREFLINYVFELTLAFSEKIITGRVKDTPEMEERLWRAINGAVYNMLDAGKK